MSLLRAEDEKTTSYLHGLEKMFQRQFPETLDINQLLKLVDQADPEAAEFLAERLSRDDMHGRNGEVTRILEISTVLVWGITGMNTFQSIAQTSADTHIPGASGKIYLKRRGRFSREIPQTSQQTARDIRLTT